MFIPVLLKATTNYFYPLYGKEYKNFFSLKTLHFFASYSVTFQNLTKKKHAEKVNAAWFNDV